MTRRLHDRLPMISQAILFLRQPVFGPYHAQEFVQGSKQTIPSMPVTMPVT